MVEGEARFSDPREGLSACKKLQGCFQLNYRHRVSVEPNISATLRVPERVYNVCREQVDEVIKTKIADMRVDASSKQVDADNWQIWLKADDIDKVTQAKDCLSHVTKGEVLDCSHSAVLKPLLTSAGRQMLCETETSAYVSVDSRRKTISIHGPLEARKKVQVKINTFLTTKVEVEMLPLRGDGRPPGLLKAIRHRYGDDLDCLRQDAALRHIHVDYRSHQLTLLGPRDSIETAKKAVEDVDKTLRAAGPQNAAKDEDMPECAICFCPIEQRDLYRLEICAHPFCTGCIAAQVTIAIKDHNLPVVCCQETCNRPLARRDFSYLSHKGHFEINDLAAPALSAYVLANRDKARFCATPYCPVVYLVTSEEQADVFLCPECETGTCTACHEKDHEGMTCEMLRRCLKAGGGVGDWVREDPSNRKACPGCGNILEKTGGCRKMYCKVCGIIFCWVCLQRFASANDCYDHLVSNHGGIFGDQNCSCC